MSFEAARLRRELDLLTNGANPARWVVALSGGLDSTVLLHALVESEIAGKILAIHVNHGLQREAAAWSAHCQQIAADLGVSFQAQLVVVAENAGSGVEAAARMARYAALRELLASGDCLLTAHNEDDQGETLLLNLLRGSGAEGLAGIARHRPLGAGNLLRPLLSVSRKDIEQYAVKHRLNWLEDPSNADTRFDRNFLRHEVLPVLASRWPAVAKRLSRSAALQGELGQLLSELADSDLAGAGTPDRLSIMRLKQLSGPRQRNVLRRAIRQCELPAAPATRLQQITDELIPAREDAQPVVFWPGVEVRRFRDAVFIQPTMSDSALMEGGVVSAGGGPYELGPQLGSLTLVTTTHAGISPALAKDGLQVRARSGGEEIRVAGHQHTRKLKALLRENAILPWMRPKVPLLYAGEQLVAVANLWLSADFLQTPGYVVRWCDQPHLK